MPNGEVHSGVAICRFQDLPIFPGEQFGHTSPAVTIVFDNQYAGHEHGDLSETAAKQKSANGTRSKRWNSRGLNKKLSGNVISELSAGRFITLVWVNIAFFSPFSGKSGKSGGLSLPDGLAFTYSASAAIAAI
jgi:hypothetical protein